MSGYAPVDQCSFKLRCTAVNNGFAVKHTFFFGDIIISDF